jgi:hypothetical protein
MLKDKIKELLSNADSDILNQFFGSEIGNEDSKWDSEEVIEFKNKLRENNIAFEHTECFGGEGMGDQYWSVYKFTGAEESNFLYVKFNGWYQSYNGSEYTDWFFVKPKEVLRTEYVEV